jgi:hypothetical protein
MIIGTDVDLTIIRTDKIWLAWLEKMFGKKDLPTTNIDYNLDNYYLEEHRETDYAFTREWFFDREGLYEKKRLSIIREAAEVCCRLKSRGHSVYAITDCSNKNLVSKFVMCKSFFLMDKVFRRSNKAEVDVDVFIDDRNKYLNQFKDKENVILIKYDTPYTQDEELLPEVKDRVITVSDKGGWYDIYRIILQEEEKRGI